MIIILEDQKTPKKIMLLDPLFALLCVDIPRRAQTTLMTSHQRAQDPVLAHPTDGLVVALGRPRTGIKLGPVDLVD